MHLPTLAAGALWLLTAAVHGFLGGREILRPVLVAPLGKLVRGVSEVAWHLLTWQFAVFGAAGVAVGMGGNHQLAFAWVSGALSLGFAALFLGFGLLRFGHPWMMPQWVLFLPIAGLSFVGLAPDSIPWGALSQGAGVAAGVMLIGLAALHVAWALGSSFPAPSRAELARLVVGQELPGSIMPGKAATWAVAVLLLAAAGGLFAFSSLQAVATVLPVLRGLAGLVAVVFALRGIGGFFEVVLRPAIRGTPYMVWSRRLYSPLSLLLALLIGLRAGF